jgi:hypothetical protein
MVYLSTQSGTKPKETWYLFTDVAEELQLSLVNAVRPLDLTYGILINPIGNQTKGKLVFIYRRCGGTLVITSERCETHRSHYGILINPIGNQTQGNLVFIYRRCGGTLVITSECCETHRSHIWYTYQPNREPNQRKPGIYLPTLRRHFSYH